MAKNLSIKNRNIRIQIWDTAGQEAFRSITRTYYKSSTCAFIVYDISDKKTFDNVITWLNECRDMCYKDILICLIGNKCDLEGKRAVSYEEGKNFAEENNLLFFETSAKDGTNIQECFNESATILDTARKFYEGTETHLRSSLAKFLFYGENVFKRVGKISGGEKVRLKLFELIQKRANLLILDEPTNHIDIDTKEMLEEALSEFQGTLLFISHDRYFINKLAQRVINIEDESFHEYLGNYDYYKEQKAKTLAPSQTTSAGRRK